MQPQLQKYLNYFNRLLDVALIIVSYYAAIYLWLLLVKDDPYNIATSLDKAFLLAFAYALMLVLLYQVAGLYDSMRARRLWKESVRVMECNALGVLGVAAVLYLFRLQEFSRGVLATFYLLSCVLIIAKRVLLRYVLRHYRNMGFNQKHVIIVGNGALARQYVASVRDNPQFGFAIDGYVGDADALEGVPYLGGAEVLPELLSGPGVDEVVAALEPQDEQRLPEIIAATEKQGTKVSIIPFYNDYIPACTTFEVIGESKLINVRTTPLDNVVLAAVKRLTDVVGSLLLIVVSSPLMLLAAVGTRISSPGPIVFKQERVGLQKRIFTMYKFRSMRVNTDANTAWTKDADPRRTKFGSFMRKTSIDELPQFFNVLKGDMSLVGPRPEIPYYVEQFRETIPLYMVKHQVRPGITGWAQVKGYRGDTSIEERIKCDIWYIENWSLSLDIRILFMTVFGGLVNQEKLTK